MFACALNGCKPHGQCSNNVTRSARADYQLGTVDTEPRAYGDLNPATRSADIVLQQNGSRGRDKNKEGDE